MARSRGPLRRAPERSCAACRRRGPKRGLVRLVRTPDGQVDVDPTGRRPGRGAYLCADRTCWEEALKRKALNRALRTVLTAEEVARLRQYAEDLPIETEEAAGGEEAQAGTEQ